MSLNGATAIVTGGNSGIGKAIVLALAEPGANVVIDYIADPDAEHELWWSGPRSTTSTSRQGSSSLGSGCSPSSGRWCSRGAGSRRVPFAATAATIVLAVIMLFVELYPRVMVSSTAFANSLTVTNAASGHHTLTVMTVATVQLLPVVLAYQFCAYRVFRVRVSGEHAASPAYLLAPRGSGPKDGGAGGAPGDA